MHAKRLACTSLVIAAATVARIATADDPPVDPAVLAHGRYMVIAGGCNDCHTPGYAEAGGETPDADWLTGVPVGFAGPWGVSYPANLRLNVQAMTEDQWIARARSPLLPPMPWFTLAHLKDDDVRAMYRFIHSLGPAGEPMPPPVAPGGKVTTPVMDFFPHPFGPHSDAPPPPAAAQ
jgi:mono/diheme cytochrome c family protein